MSVGSDGSQSGAHDGVAPLFARAAAADARTHARLQTAINDLLAPEDARLDDRTRAAVQELLARLVATVEGDLRLHAGRSLATRGEPDLAASLSGDSAPVLARLIEAGVIRDADFFGELIGRARLGLLADALPVAAPEGEEASLLARLANHADRVVATNAVAVLVADSRRTPEESAPILTELPAELHHKLVWWIAAALREGRESAAVARALSDAAQRSIAAHDEGERPEAAAIRLASALDAKAAELPGLLIGALGDRRAGLFVALIGHSLGIEFGLVRDALLDPAGERLWLMLRALEMPRETIARIGLALSEADPRRDIESFADSLDTIAAIDPGKARDALAPLKLDPAFRAASLTLGRAR